MQGPCALQGQPGGLVAWPLAGERRWITGLQGGIETRYTGEGRYQLLGGTSTPTPSSLILHRFSVCIRCKKLGIDRVIGRTKRPLQIDKSPLISRRGAGCKSGISVHTISSSPPSTITDELTGESPPSPPIFDPTRSPPSRSEALLPPPRVPSSNLTSPVHVPCSETAQDRPDLPLLLSSPLAWVRNPAS